MTTRFSQTGVSLVEAMIALGVMAFGMLGLVGLQANMRANADASKQRSEAVRIAQARIEDWRGYTALNEYRDNIVDVPAAAASAATNTNTVFLLSATVVPAPTNPPTTPPLKSAVVTVAWEGRASDAQSVTLTTRIGGVAPVVAAAVAAPATGDPTRRPQGRHPAIPPGAVNQGDGTSRFVTPGANPVGWVFSNTTGVILSICATSFAPGSCSPANLLLLSGYVVFDDTLPTSGGGKPTQPTVEQTVDPVGNPRGLQVRVQVQLTQPNNSRVDCLTASSLGTYVPYYCAMPVSTTPPFAWSGRTQFEGVSGMNIVSNLNDDDEDKFRVCRYTTENSNAPPGGNLAHPLDYTNVTQSLANQNYFVIRAGNDSVPFTCPDDKPGDFVNSLTHDHQPPRP